MGWWLNASDIILIMGASGACCVSIIYAVCVNMRLSRCRTIKCCCLNCDRDIETAEEMAMELEADEHRREKNNSINRNNPAGNPRADV